MRGMLWKTAAKPVGVVLLFYFHHLKITSNGQIGRASSLLLHLHSCLILSHCRSLAWRESRFSACRGRCISTPEWILIRMKLWSKCGWRWSLSRCCTPSPSTSCPASAPRTSAAPPIRTCMSEPQRATPLSTSPVAAHPHVSSRRVKELSHHFSEMNPVRQKWIYTFFMYPFLSGDRVDGKPPAKLSSPLEAAAAVLNDFTYFTYCVERWRFRHRWRDLIFFLITSLSVVVDTLKNAAKQTLIHQLFRLLRY